MNETGKIEGYLQGTLPPEAHLLMSAGLLVDAELREKVSFQQKVYELIKQRGRKNLRREIEAVQVMMFTEKRFENFRFRIRNIINKI